MKNKLNVLVATTCTIFIFSIIVLIGCKKENLQNINNEGINVRALAFTGNVSVSTEGFLIFPTADDLAEFGDYLEANTHSDVESYLSGIGFTSYASDQGLYESTPNEYVADDEQIDFALDASRMIQVGDKIMKPISSDVFLLVMLSSNNNSTSYEDMAAGTYNSTYMNQFATHGPINAADDDLNTFMAGVPTGHEEVTPHTPPPSGPMSGGKFWGKTYSEDPCDGTGHKQVTVTYWRFWMKAGHDYYYVDCDVELPTS